MLRIITLASLTLSLLTARAQINQLNPIGPAFNFTDAHLFNDQTLYLATGLPFLVKVDDLTDSVGWKQNFRVIYTDSIIVDEFQVLTKSIFAIGPHFTRDGGQSFSYLHRPNDEEIYFADGQDWAVINNVRELFYSSDAGNSWQKAPGLDWHFWNKTQNGPIFYRHTDTTAWHFTQDSLFKIMRMRKVYPGFATYTWVHQLDNFRYAFEQQRRVHIYDTILDTLSILANHYFQSNYTQVYIEGKRIVREEPAGKLQIANAPNLNWQSRSPGYNGPSFAHSNGVSFYNSYLPYVPFGKGNLAYFKLNGTQRQLLGNNKHPVTGRVYATNDSNLFYSPGVTYSSLFLGKFFNQGGVVVADDSSAIPFRFVRFDSIHGGLAYLNQQSYKSNNNGKTWLPYRSASDYVSGSLPYHFRDLQYGANGKCLWAWVRESRLGYDDWVGREKGNGTLSYDQIITQYRGSIYDHNQFLALNCDTALLIRYGKAMLTTAGPQNFSRASWTDTLVLYSLIHDGSKVIANTSVGFFSSTDLVNWTKFAPGIMQAPIMAVAQNNNYFGLHNYHLHFSRDSGQTVNKVLLPWSPLGSIAVVNGTDLLMGGEFGQLYLFKRATTANVFVSKEEVESPATNIIYFPNPAHDFFTLQWNEASAGRLQLFNISGEQVRELPFHKTDRLELNISDLQTGIYIIKLEVGGKWEQVKLLVD